MPNSSSGPPNRDPPESQSEDDPGVEKDVEEGAGHPIQIRNQNGSGEFYRSVEGRDDPVHETRYPGRCFKSEYWDENGYEGKEGD